MKTDTKALAAAIDAFESEFPDAIWSVGKLRGAGAVEDFVPVASSFADDPVRAMKSITEQMRERAERRRVAAAHDAALDAEYGPEVAA